MTLRRLPVLERLDRDAFAALGPEWPELLADSPVTSPFMTWPWIGAWLDTIGVEADLMAVAARDADDGRLLGVAPFHVVTRRRAGIRFRELRFVGSGLAAPDHLDLIVRRGAGHEVASALWDAVLARRAWDVVDLDGVAADGWLADLALRRAEDRADEVPAPYLPLDEDWDAVRARFGRSHRQNIGRYRRKMDAEAGAPVVERMVADSADLDRTFDRLVEMHQAVRSSKGDPGLFADESMRAFLRSVAHRMLRDGRLRMWRLDVGGDAVAVIWCMRAFDAVSFYTTGYDAEWSRYGPGRRIMARAIRAAAAEGASEFDFLRGDEPYKQAWGTEVRHDLRIRRPASAKGRLLWAIRGGLRRLRRSARSSS